MDYFSKKRKLVRVSSLFEDISWGNLGEVSITVWRKKVDKIEKKKETEQTLLLWIPVILKTTYVLKKVKKFEAQTSF